MAKIYLDTNVWSRAFDKPSQRIIEETKAFFNILEKSYAGKLAIVGSTVLDVEVDRRSNLEKRAANNAKTSENLDRLVNLVETLVMERTNNP